MNITTFNTLCKIWITLMVGLMVFTLVYGLNFHFTHRTNQIKIPITLNIRITNPPDISIPDEYTDFVWDIQSEQQYHQEITCLAENIYFEARNQSTTGQIVVGLVTINRVKASNFPNTICDVVWQKRKSPTSGKTVAQFSWTLDGKSDIPSNKSAWTKSYRLASAMLAERSLNNFDDTTKGSTHYHAWYVTPSWGSKLTYVAQFDDHLLYKEN